MTAIPHAARALTSALGRFERASTRTLEAATGVGDDTDIAATVVEMIEAKTQVKAAVAIVRFSDEMWKALLELQREERPRR
jgi:flagellar hook protein FlgE